MAIFIGPMGVQVNDSMFVAREFKCFPGLRLTRHAWLIGSYDGLRAFVTSMKLDETARKIFTRNFSSANRTYKVCRGIKASF